MRNLVLWLVSVIFFAGCASTPTGNIAAFGSAAKGVTEKIEEVIKEYNEESVSNELTKIAQRKKIISTSSLDPVRKVIIGGVDKKKYALYKANYALGSYADAISGLAKSGSRDEIDLAATKLYSSLHGFNEQYKTLENTEENLINDETSASVGKVFAAIGGIYAEKKRGEAIQKIVKAADPYVQKIGEVIIKELMGGVIETRLYTIRNTELSGYIKDYNLAPANFSDKRLLIDGVYKRYLEMQSSSASVSQAIEGVRAVMKAHSVLKNEVEKGKFSSAELIKEISRLKDLESHYDDLEALMLSCSTEVVADDAKGIICKNE